MSLKRIAPGGGGSARTAHTHAATAPTTAIHRGIDRGQDTLLLLLRRFPNGEDAVHGNVVQRLHGAAGPSDLERPHRALPAQTEMHALVAGGEVTAAGCHGGELAGAGLAYQVQARADAIAIADRSHRVDGQPVIGASLERGGPDTA